MDRKFYKNSVALSSFSNFLPGILARMKGPGGLYNVGNMIALLGGFAAFCLISDIDAGVIYLAGAYFFGSLGTGCLTLAIVIFLISGEAYYRAWVGPHPPHMRLNQLGDFLSGIAAIILTFSLASFGETVLAIVAGCLLAFGKFGTALLPERPSMSNAAAIVTSGFRVMVIVSRVPSIGALGFSLFIFSANGGDRIDAMMALIMLTSYVFWLAADYRLVGSRPATTMTEA